LLLQTEDTSSKVFYAFLGAYTKLARSDC